MIKWKRLGSSIVGNCKPLYEEMILHETKQNLREKGRITQCKNPVTKVRKYFPKTSYQSPRNCLATDCLTSYRYSLHYNFKVVLGSAVCHKLFPPLNTLVLGSAVCHKLFPPLNTSVLGSAVHQLFFPPPTVSFEALRSAVHLC